MKQLNKVLVSVVIPTYNEEKTIKNCLASLADQTCNNFEVIIVDDGSMDQTESKISEFAKSNRIKKLNFYRQDHKGPGEARNLGANKSHGKILVFVDADMTFDTQFMENLTQPINEGKTIGTDSQSEFLENSHNYWALSWNIGRYSAAGIISNKYKTSMVPNRKDTGGIFRAILKKEFVKAGGFEMGGDYTDDTSLTKKLKRRATLANKAVFYHSNPEDIQEVWRRATWIGSGKMFTSSLKLKLLNLIKFSLPAALVKGIIIAIQYDYPQFMLFKLIYDSAIWTSVLRSI